MLLSAQSYLENGEGLIKVRNPKSIRDLPHFAAFKYRDFRYLWIANMFSGAAMWTFITASSWLILTDSDSSSWVGIMTFASMLPFLIVSPIGGLMADRFDRVSLAQIAFFGSFLVTAVMAALAIAGIVELWHIAVLAFIGGTLRATQEPTISSLIPNQVPRENLLNAITLNASTRHGAKFFGLLIASPLMAVPFIGVPGVLVMSAIFGGIALLLLSRIRTLSRGESNLQGGVMSGVVNGMKEGLVYIYTNKAIGLFMIMVSLHCALVMSFESILPVFSRQNLGALDGSFLGYLGMGFGAGSLVATFWMAGIRNDKRKGQLLIWTGIGSGITPIALALTGNVFPAVAAAVAMGAAQSMFMALTSTYIQLMAPDRLRGRISSLYILHAGGIMAFANLGYGFVADAFSAPPILIATGAIFIGAIFALYLAQPILRRVYSTGQLQPA